ncbi:hypothetical protein LSAT2_006072 [Lamellibrachia satsuma]|nr:hypothetical protein LSAT2_006072 [Lamellibrachia satsuma]
MAAVRLYVTLALLLLATCFHSSEGGWWRRRRRRGCSRVNCQWSAWSSWGSCNHYCSKYNMQRRTRRVIRSASCGGSSCSGPAKQIRICSCRSYRDCMTFPEKAVGNSPYSFPCSVRDIHIGKSQRREIRTNVNDICEKRTIKGHIVTQEETR